MSHFTVLVPAKDQAELEARLLPYHEYECTGIEAYTEFVPHDMDELQKDYAEYGDGRPFDEFIPDWCGGFKNEQGVWGRKTNPNAKWDWWVIGGRWSGTLLLKPGSWGKGTNGEGGVMSSANTDPKRADSALAGDIDWDAMQAEQCAEKLDLYRKWQSLPDKDTVDDDAYRKALMDSDLFWVDRLESDDLNSMTEAEYVAKWGEARAGTFAYIDLDAKWNARADMGWFAMESDHNEDYHAAWRQFVRSLPAEQRVYVVDCHI